ncbi:MAG: hypothetical protein M1833_005012 [Piccolia ochrophora]|nr:MAG: hypothetical protein M1833_005012 [Piccolia ochrophora]
MSGCAELINATIAKSSDTWGTVDRSALADFTITSYLRPDTGAALLPWVYTIIIIIIHVPVVIVRVTRWDIVQTWCLVSTFFTIVVYVQAYISTNFAAEKILVWTPLILVIDAGSMLQIFFLVLEATPVLIEGRIFLFDPKEGKQSERTNLLGRLQRWRGGTETAQQDLPLVEAVPNLGVEPTGNNGRIAPGGHDAQDDNMRGAPQGAPADDIDSEDAPSTTRQVRLWQDPAIYTAIASAILFVVVIVLQILGLHAAVVARKAGKSPLVSWCSPTFQPFGVATLDGDCHVYNIDQSISRGIGCIKIPGVWQRQWLTGTVVGTAMSLVFQFIDLIILYLVGGTRKWRGVKMKRPWTTMISGLVILCITLFYGLQYASMLPPGITERVTIAVEVNGTKAFNAKLTSAGLRGTIIGWNDGLFESWHGSYTGTSLG